MTQLHTTDVHTAFNRAVQYSNEIVSIAVSLGLCDNRTKLVYAANQLETIVIDALQDIEALQAEVTRLKSIANGVINIASHLAK